MEFLLRLAAFVFKFFGILITPILILINWYNYKLQRIPPIENELLKLSVVDLAEKIRNREVTSEEIVAAYIARIKLINPIINAVVQDRFVDALAEAKKADIIVKSMTTYSLIKDYPIMGVPFTVKESCGLKGFIYSVGSKPRKGLLAQRDGTTVANLRSAGGIPLLISNTPEFCTSWETSNFITGRSLNPHNLRRSPGGSSGGEAALIGAGASLFGVGSDIAGSIRIPSMFTGIFGHKPTGGLMCVKGHFPISTDESFSNYLVVGPMCRYAKDLPTLVYIMAGDNASKLQLEIPVKTKDIKIYFMEDAGFSMVDIPVQNEIKIAMYKAIQHFKNNGLDVKPAPFETFQETLEMGLSQVFSLTDIPNILQDHKDPNQVDNLVMEFMKSFVGQSNYSFAGLMYCMFRELNGFIPKSHNKQYLERGQKLKKELIDLLGENGVLFYPTFPTASYRHNESYGKICGVMYALIFNVLGLPSTHVPLGKDKSGLPIGIQIVAAPYQDRLCLCIASELEAAFGGWTPPY